MIMSPTAATKTMVEVMADLKTRVAACQAAYDVYDPACSRRATHDSLVEVGRSLDAVGRWLTGDNDQPVAWMLRAATQEGRDTYRIHYAADSLVAAEHYILAAEFWAGPRTRESVDMKDPWRYVNHVQQAEAERLRLAEGITFHHNDPVKETK